MPLIALAVLSYAAGLVAGFIGSPAAAILSGIAYASVAALNRRGTHAALGALVVAGACVAMHDAATAARCRADALHGGEWAAEPEDAAAPGAYVRATMRWAGCAMPASMSVETGRAAAGARVSIRGSVFLTARGLKIAHARISPLGSRDALLLARAGIGARIDTLFRKDAPLVRALLIADERAVDPAVKDRFAVSGIVHMLSISGLHVAIIAMAVELLCRMVRLRPATASIATLVITALYIAVIGLPAPAVRSGVMLGVRSLCRMLQRPTSPWAALALGAAVPLVSPATVLDLGYQLSVLGMAGLVASGALGKRVIPATWSGTRGSLARALLTSCVACCASAPLVAWTFGRISLVAPITNILATPVVAVLQPALFLAVAVSPLRALGMLLADACHPLLLALDTIATVGASVPFAALTVAPTLPTAILAGAASIAMLVACMSRAPARAIAISIGALTVAAWRPLWPVRDGRMELHMIDVGQGDAIALRTPAGRWLLFDAGRNWTGGDAGRATVIPYLRRRGGDVVLFVLSHPHADHVGGGASVIAGLHPTAYWDGAYAGTSPPYRASLVAASEQHVAWRRVHPGDSLVVDGVRLHVLAPDSAWMIGLKDPNAGSVVVRAEYGAIRMLMMGDAEKGEEERLVEEYGDSLRADVLKVGHHGSNTSSTPAFLARVHPRVALISVGAGNMYGHPSASTLRSLAGVGAAVLRTDLEGSIVCRTDGRTLEVEEGGDRWVVGSQSKP
ncbi:MAG: DNA internalization-related competence protein ComEC/Rec2 [Gemmatimonadaceae bacterium]|nr:DNA internalization-related competence protein ComEC/Rec2 [Gemmatimonadaceae bacterium]